MRQATLEVIWARALIYNTVNQNQTQVILFKIKQALLTSDRVPGMAVFSPFAGTSYSRSGFYAYSLGTALGTPRAILGVCLPAVSPTVRFRYTDANNGLANRGSDGTFFAHLSISNGGEEEEESESEELHIE